MTFKEGGANDSNENSTGSGRGDKVSSKEKIKNFFKKKTHQK